MLLDEDVLCLSSDDVFPMTYHIVWALTSLEMDSPKKKEAPPLQKKVMLYKVFPVNSKAKNFYVLRYIFYFGLIFHDITLIYGRMGYARSARLDYISLSKVRFVYAPCAFLYRSIRLRNERRYSNNHGKFNFSIFQ